MKCAGDMKPVFVRAVRCLLRCAVGSVADPGSGAFLTPGSGIDFFRIPDPKPIFLRVY
jgi:hypothetical protein